MIIKLGSKGADVILIQQHLNKLGFIVASTGPGSPDKETDYFGPMTESAVMRFQKANKLKVDGVVGLNTWGMLASFMTSEVDPVVEGELNEEDFSDPEDEMLVESLKESYPTCKNISELIKLINQYKITRKIKQVVYHCTATQPEATVAAILKYWKDNLKWKSPGYHIIVTTNGSWTLLHDFNLPSNGVQGINSSSIHISYIGGINKVGKAKDTRTDEQKAVFEACYHLFKRKLPNATHHGHYEFANKSCPSFMVDSWIKSISSI
jgi:N-acetylmuramoyl-L-alanine amidase